MLKTKLHNVIFPIWLIIFIPPVILFTLTGNFIIDSGVVIVCFFCYKVSTEGLDWKRFYKKSILKVWLFGFLADFIGALILFMTGILGEVWKFPYDVSSAINYDPFNNIWAVLIIVFAMLISGILILIFNYCFTYKSLVTDRHLRFKIALTIALITIPWTFLLPTKWFYYGP